MSSAHPQETGVSAASPSTARLYSLTLPEAMPAIQSSPSTPYGATAASDTAATQRSGNNAAHASACGPPPDQPIVTNSSATSSPRIASTSLTASAIERPCFAVDVP